MDKYISCDILVLPTTLQNTQHQHIWTCKKKNHVIFIFHYPLPPMNTTKILHPFESKKDLPFNKKYFKQQTILFILNLLKPIFKFEKRNLKEI